MRRHPDSRYIVFDGIDGCGKTTQIGMLGDCLFNLNKQYSLVLTREPTYRKYGMELRTMLANDKDPMNGKDRMLELYVLDREDHLRSIVMPMLSRGFIVLQDRGKYSTVAYQGAQGVDIGEIVQKHSNMIVPDATIIFDLPVEEAARRQQKEGRQKEKFESLDFQTRVAGFYSNMQHVFPRDSIIHVSALGDCTEVHKRTVAALKGTLPYR